MLEGKNKAQIQAIVHRNGPMMVLAGPGSGKTMVITERTKYLIERYHIDPSKILVITFTKAAANEMKQRFHALTGNKGYAVSFGTFHAVFFTILRHAYGYRHQDIITQEQKKQMIQEILHEQKVELADEQDFLSAIINEISLVKAEMIPLKNYYSSQCGNEVFQEVYTRYNKKLHLNRKIDFDDMLVFTYELFCQRKDILAAWHKKFPYILIDEFQDINYIQYKIIQMLASPENHLFIVGDDDQSIYRFRGAKPDIMLGFEKEYPTAQKVILNKNYRCSEEILTEAQKVICQNKKRFPKNLEACCGKYAPVHYQACKNQFEEMKFIIDYLRSHQEKGKNLSQCAVLFRTNTQARLLVGKLSEYQIPFIMKETVSNIFEHFIAKDFIVYMQLARGSRQRNKVLAIINRPNRYVGRDYLQDTKISFSKLAKAYGDMDWMRERISKLQYDLKMLETMSPYASIIYIRKAIGYDVFLEEYARVRNRDLEELYDLANEIQESARGYRSFEGWMQYIKNFSEKLKQKNLQEPEKEAVTLTTMHGSKGLEYHIVFILDVIEGMIPHKKAVKLVDIEEERRMLYVAMTRAKKELYLMIPTKYNNKECIRSRFLNYLEP